MLTHGWWGLAACAVLLTFTLANQNAGAEQEPSERPILVCGAALDGSTETGAALADLAVAALSIRSVPALRVDAPAECARGAATTTACRNALLGALVRRDVHAAFIPVPAESPPNVLDLRDNGLEEMGDITLPARLACFATRALPQTRSLLDFSSEAVAARYSLSDDNVATLRRLSCTNSNCSDFDFTPDWCMNSNTSCSILLISDEEEGRLLSEVVHTQHLNVRVVTLGRQLFKAIETIRRPILVCKRAMDPEVISKLRLEPLGPPPCLPSDDVCSFDSYRLVKVMNAQELVQSPTASSVLGQIHLNETELRDYIHLYQTSGASVAITEALERHRKWTNLTREVRVAVMIPLTTYREAFDASFLTAAALLAEEDSPKNDTAVSFKVELLNDECGTSLAYKYLNDAVGTEFGALSGVAGPACGAAFLDVARQSPTIYLPVLAYTPQARPPATAGEYAVLAAGDARRYTDAWAAFIANMGWRRIAVLSELATRPALDVAKLGVNIIVHDELQADIDTTDADQLVPRWAERVAAENGRVMYVYVEDARVVRAALCAGRAAGLMPRAGAVWLLPATLPPYWLRPSSHDTHNCTREQLEEVADGHFSVAPSWLADWQDSDTGVEEQRRAWSQRCSDQCRRSRYQPCAKPSAHAALLYDTLRLWDAALRRVLLARPAALDNLHHKEIVKTLIENTTAADYNGLTGTFNWDVLEGGTRARSSSLIIMQWVNGTQRRIAELQAGTLTQRAMPVWLTVDGSIPEDGSEHCSLQPLADLLSADCRTAFVALGALLLVLPVLAMAVAAWQCKRRAERKYRERLAALGLSPLSPKPGGLDRWEIPRERVVINRKLGTGAFGTVYGGHALLAEDRGWTAVAVKTLKAGASTEEKLDFLSEAEAMKRFDHKNVVRLLGVVTKTEPVCTVMEFMLYGDLKNYLLARRHLASAEAEREEVSATRLTSMALDAARALSYLAQLRYVHRDVAARNCLVSAHRVVKLADFGMTRLVFENDYYRFSRKGMLPVRWMAPESLALGVFSPASDVWSFGVLLYEIVTFGSLPFQGLSNAEVLARVKAGHTLELPTGLKPQLEGLIKSCWQQDHKARPCAAEIAAFLADSPRLLTPCLDVPLDALPLDIDDWRLERDRAEARWVSWAAPASATTDTTYLSTDAPPRDTDAFLT